jgi:hypothetical protein
MELQDRITVLEQNLEDLRAHQVVLLAEVEALMFCTIAALRCAPQEAAMMQLSQQIEKLRAMALASPTTDDVEDIRATKAQQVYNIVSSALKQPAADIGSIHVERIDTFAKSSPIS